MNYCPKCGAMLNAGAKFCSACGANLEEPQNNTPNQNIDSSYISNKTVNDEELLDAYIGENADKIKKGGFSTLSLFFNVIYFFYRKMWLLAIIYLFGLPIVTLVIDKISDALSGIVTIAANITLACLFKKMYLKNATKKINEIKNKNPGKTNEELKEICRKKGGTTWVPVIIIIVINVIAVAIATILIMYFIDKNKNKDNENDYVESEASYEEKVETVDEMSYFKSNLFDSHNYTNFNSHYSKYDTNYYCIYRVEKGTIKRDGTAQEVLEDYISSKISSNSNGINDIEINGEKWLTTTLTTTYDEINYYAIEKGENVYSIKFEINIDKDGTCTKAKKELLNSIEFK